MNLKKIFEKMNAQKDDILDKEDNLESSTSVNNEIKEEKPMVEKEGEKKIEELQAKVDELNDKYLRLYSEFDNYRKRVVKERAELIKTAGEDIFKDILPTMDELERALKSTNEATDIKLVKEGFNLVYQKLKKTLHQKGLEEIVSIEKEFDTDLHEAITNVPAPTEDLKGKVMDEIEKGYTLNGKVIRFAKVIVGK